MGPQDVSLDEVHVVQFYETDPFLCAAVTRFVGAAVAGGDVALVIATQRHREQIGTELGRRGFDLELARGQGYYVALDAAEILSQITVDGKPDPARFAEVVGGLISRGQAEGRRVRVFGEMVALLWDSGKTDAAIRLEELWSGLAQALPFSLLCAYPIRAFDRASDEAPFRRICGEHSHVLPADGYPRGGESDRQLRLIAALQQKASALEAEVARRDQAERELAGLYEREREARSLAEAASRAKDDFLSVVSHELRTPLASILGWAAVLESDGTDASTARAVEAIERSGRTQLKLIEDLLDASRIVSGKLRLDLQLVDPPAILRAALDAIRPSAEAKRIALEACIDPAAGPISGDADRLQQIAGNLLSNAVKFTPSGGRIDVSLERREDDVVFTVRDDGCGIAPAFLPHVFERFRQADPAKTRRTGGLGLGLAIVRHLAELHGGTVGVESPGEGRGTTFTVTLPLAGRVDAGAGA